MNLKNFTRKEKTYISLICISLIVIVSALIYRYFLSDVTEVYWWQPQWKYEDEIRKINIYLAVFLALLAGGATLIFATNRLTKEDLVTKQGVGSFDEFSKAKIGKASNWGYLIYLPLLIVILLLVFTNENFQTHLFLGHNAEEHIHAALYNPSKATRTLNSALHFERSDAKIDFLNGMLFSTYSLAFGVQLGKLLTWLKYR